MTKLCGRLNEYKTRVSVVEKVKLTPNSPPSSLLSLRKRITIYNSARLVKVVENICHNEIITHSLTLFIQWPHTQIDTHYTLIWSSNGFTHKAPKKKILNPTDFLSLTWTDRKVQDDSRKLPNISIYLYIGRSRSRATKQFHRFLLLKD